MHQWLFLLAIRTWDKKYQMCDKASTGATSVTCSGGTLTQFLRQRDDLCRHWTSNQNSSANYISSKSCHLYCSNGSQGVSKNRLITCLVLTLIFAEDCSSKVAQFVLSDGSSCDPHDEEGKFCIDGICRSAGCDNVLDSHLAYDQVWPLPTQFYYVCFVYCMQVSKSVTPCQGRFCSPLFLPLTPPSRSLTHVGHFELKQQLFKGSGLLQELHLRMNRT